MSNKIIEWRYFTAQMIKHRGVTLSELRKEEESFIAFARLGNAWDVFTYVLACDVKRFAGWLIVKANKLLRG